MNQVWKKRITIALICLASFVMYIVLGYVHYETNDDIGFNSIAGGPLANSEKLFFINVLYGWILKVFYSITNGINWYLWIMLVLNVIGLTSLCIVISQDFNIKKSVLITVIINIAVGGQVYNDLQFTKNASFLLVVGFVVMADSIRKTKGIHISKFIIGLMFFLLGYMIRVESFTILIPYFALYILAVVVSRIICDRRNKSKVSIKRFISCVIVPAVIVLISMSIVRGVDYYVMHSSEEWKTYWNYHALRSDLRDRGTPDYESNKDMYDSIGWDENELNLFRFWITADDASLVMAEYTRISGGLPGTFTPEQFEAADMDNDGVLSASDASEILRLYTELSSRDPTSPAQNVIINTHIHFGWKFGIIHLIFDGFQYFVLVHLNHCKRC